MRHEDATRKPLMARRLSSSRHHHFTTQMVLRANFFMADSLGWGYVARSLIRDEPVGLVFTHFPRVFPSSGTLTNCRAKI